MTEIGSINDSNNYSTFGQCTALKKIILPNTVENIRPFCFYGCTSLSDINLQNENITNIQNEAFRNCTSLKVDIYLPNLTSLGGRVTASVFQNTGVVSVSSLGRITKLWGHGSSTYGTFYECVDLTTVNLPETLQSIGGSCFYGCTALNTINFPIALTTVESRAFYNCTSLAIEDLSLPNLETLGQNAFYGVSIKKISNLGKITALPTASSFTQNFGKKDVLEEVVLPDTLTNIDVYSFSGYTSLMKCNIPASVTTIRRDAFNSVPAPLVVDLPNLTSLDAYVFVSSGISEINNLGTITSIGDQLCRHCTSLKHVVLPETLTSMSAYTFHNCTSLEYVICHAVTPPTVGISNFDNSNNCPIYVPDASVTAYQEATNWSTYADRIRPLSEMN